MSIESFWEEYERETLREYTVTKSVSNPSATPVHVVSTLK